MTMSPYDKPLPRLLPETAGYWEAARKGRLVIQQCTACGKRIYFPRLICPHCLGQDLDWTESAGRGAVYSYTIVRQAARACFTGDLPYVYALIELDEGVRMISNIIHVDPARVHIGMRVRVVFEEATPEISLPKFEPDGTRP